MIKKNPARQFDRLVRPHIDHLYRVAWRLTGSKEDAEDLVQDVLIKMFDQFDRLEKLDNPRTWMARVLHNRFVDQYRRAQRWSPLEEADSYAAEDIHEAGTSAVADPEASALRAADRATINRALRKLDQDQQLLLILHIVEEYSLPELVEVFDAPLGTLKSRLHRARSYLKKHLGVQPVADPARVRQ